MQVYVKPSKKLLLLFIISLHVTAISGNENRTCGCYMLGTLGTIDGTSLCDNETLQCKCYSNVIGKNCNQCREGFYNILSGLGCSPCHCSPTGSINKSCNALTGQCKCKNGFSGFRCDRCEGNKYKFSLNKCLNCNCNQFGSKDLECDSTGQCPCLPNTEGKFCDKCKENTYSIKEGCIPCPSCYEFVQNGIKNYTQYLKKIEKIIKEIENNRTLLIQNNKHFLNEINLLKAKIFKLKLKYEDANKTVLSEEGIDKLSKEVEDFHEEVLDLIEKLSNENGKKIKENLYVGRTNLKGGNDLVKICEDALLNATRTAKSLNRHNKTMTLLAKEGMEISKKIEEEAEELYQLSLNTNSSCNEACNIAEQYQKKQARFNKTLEEIKNDILNTTSGVEAMRTYAKDFFEVTKISKEDTLKLKKEVDLLIVPNSNKLEDDLKEINSNLTEIDKQIKNLNETAKIIKEKEELTNNDLKEIEKNQKNMEENFLLIKEYEERANMAINTSNDVFEAAKKSLKNLEKFKELKNEAEEALKNIPEIQAKVDAVLNNSKEIKNMFHELSLIIQDLDKMKFNLSEIFKMNERNLTENEKNFKILEELEKEEREMSKKLTESHSKLKEIKADLKNLQKYELEIERLIKQIQEYMFVLNVLPTTDKELDEVEEEIQKMEDMVLAIELLKGEKEKLEKEMENVRDIIESIPIEDSSLCESAKSEPKTNES